MPAVLGPFALFAGLALVAFSLLSVWYAFRLRRAEINSLVLALCVFVVPVLSAYLMSFITPVFVIRRLLPASLGLLLLVSWTVMEAKQRWLNIAAGVSVALLMFASLVSYYDADSHTQKTPFREVIQEIEAKASSDDIFIHATDNSALAFAYYAPHLQSHFLEGDPDYVAETNRGRAQRIAGLRPEKLNSIIGDEDHFWLIVVMNHSFEYQTQVVDEFDSRFDRISSETIHGVDVLQYSTTAEIKVDPPSAELPIDYCSLIRMMAITRAIPASDSRCLYSGYLTFQPIGHGVRRWPILNDSPLFAEYLRARFCKL
jgi:hypothetical protein